MNIRRRARPSGEEIISMTSMMDLIFLLLIFFLVTTTFKQEEIDHMVNLPTDARNQSLTQSTGNLININIRKDGSYVVMGKQVTEENISTWMAEEVAKKPDIKAWWQQIAQWRARNSLSYRKSNDIILPQQAIQSLFDLDVGEARVDVYQAALFAFQCVLWRAAHHPFGRRVYVHALNGFYIGTLGNRLLDRLWPSTRNA